MGNFFCSDIKNNIRNLCEIDLIETVHDRKIKLIQEEQRRKGEEEMRKIQKEQRRKEEEKRKAEERREGELIQRRREEEMKQKIEQDCLEQFHQEKLNRRKHLEKMALGHKIKMGLPGVDIIRMKNENERDLIEIKKIDFEKVECEEIMGRNQHVHVNNKLDWSYDEPSDIDLHLKQVIDYDEDYENEDPDDDEDNENELTDQEIINKEKEAVDEYQDNRISSGSSIMAMNYFMLCLFFCDFIFSFLSLSFISMSFTNAYQLHNGLYKVYL
jgi:hypothetical protein